MKTLVLSAILILSFNVFGHEGHGPEQKMAPHGGVLRDGDALMAELVQDESGVKIYLFTHELKPVLPADVKMDSKLIQLTDAKKKSVNLEVAGDKEAVLLKFDKTTSYRFNLTVTVSYAGKQDKFSWPFEPQSN
jgi:hypothetical protein